MALQAVVKGLRLAIGSWYQAIVGSERQRARYFQYLLMGVAVIGGVVFIFFLSRWYIGYREQQAQRVFAEYAIEYRKAESGRQDNWGQIEDLFHVGSEQQAGSYLHPYFLVMRVNAAIKQGKKEEALDLMGDVVRNMSAKDPLVPLFKIKHALMKLDGADENLRQEGLQSLIALAEDGKNQYADAASFYLGQYYSAIGQVDKSQEIWQQLISQQRKEGAMISPWAGLAQSKIQ